MICIDVLDIERAIQYVDCGNALRFNPNMHDWLEVTPGDGYSLGGHGVYFYNERDAVMFILKWL